MTRAGGHIRLPFERLTCGVNLEGSAGIVLHAHVHMYIQVKVHTRPGFKYYFKSFKYFQLLL